jgi:hypothetical protein
VNLKKLDQTIKQNRDLLVRKNHDYGSDNLVKTGVYGIAVRLQDKISRLLNLLDPAKGGEPNFESVDDTLGDIANYGLLGQLMRRGGLPGTVDMVGVPKRKRRVLGRGLIDPRDNKYPTALVPRVKPLTVTEARRRLKRGAK